ncbi:SH3 domain-containing protein 1 [Elsinoe australis]|uniref:SH3 domain-containing protein 1 n=1 Tax=Elsinoe australis TaxID=40998 RepID=A0A4U7B4P2_9PEZI|nr:SH3 domain-containing protein 1 [Elsinoe australis]
MAPHEEMQTAMVNRSIRAIKAELEFLTDASIITPQTLSHILEQIPAQTALHAPISVGAVPTPSPLPGAPQPPTAAFNNTSLSEKQQQPQSYNEKTQYAPSPAPSPAPPPAYGAPPSMPPLCAATALYAYKGEDAGDLDLQPNDHIEVTEYMNAEWWKGRSSRTGQVGIFPRSYVRVEEKAMPQAPPQGQGLGNNYGNMPLEQSGMGNGTGQVPGKGQEMGKKFGKKLGNAAIFGAGATIGGNIVNSIF